MTVDSFLGLELLTSLHINHNSLTQLPANLSTHCPLLQYLGGEVHSNPVINSLKKSIHHLHFEVNRNHNNHFLSYILLLYGFFIIKSTFTMF